jgi:hypothetical protein
MQWEIFLWSLVAQTEAPKKKEYVLFFQSKMTLSSTNGKGKYISSIFLKKKPTE